MEKIKILVISDEVWSDKEHGNNVLTNWFEGFDAEFANIYCSPGKPDNNICKEYFQVTDKMMFKSLISKQKAGKIFNYRSEDIVENNNKHENKDMKIYNFLKSINLEVMRVLRETVWILGKYNMIELNHFIENYNPSIIFCARKASLKILRLERIVKNITNAPLVVFTGDDEYSLKQFRFSPIYWIHRFHLRKKLSRNTNLYSLYYTHSEQQGKEYNNKFGVDTKILFKGADFSRVYEEKRINKPMTLIYAGKLYCNRWKSLAKIVHYLKKINIDGVKIELKIYTKDTITKKQDKILNDKKNSYILGPVNVYRLKEIYKEADIALHVESFDIKNKLLTRYSFSTKIIDCLNSSCAVMAICWNQHTGYKYLEGEDAAICIDNYAELQKVLNEIAINPSIVDDYRYKAWKCGSLNHDRKKIQDEMLRDFKEILKKYRTNANS